MGSVPEEVRRRVIAELYRRFDALKWETLSNTERGEAYATFVKDPAIGGVLSKYQTKDDIRVWIKDGPAKEYKRALEGVGPYAASTSRALAGPDALIVGALGAQWSPVTGSVQQKPMRCLASDGEEGTAVVIWGGLNTLKDLFWRAALQRVSDPGQRIVLAVTKPSNASLPADEWVHVQALAKLAGVECVQVVQQARRKKPSPSS